MSSLWSWTNLIKPESLSKAHEIQSLRKTRKWKTILNEKWIRLSGKDRKDNNLNHKVNREMRIEMF